MAAGDELLVLDQVNKRFGGLKVIVDLDFRVDEEEIVGLIGPNGAGKSTVFNLVTAIYTPDTGSIRFKGREIAGMAPHKICHVGIARTYQLVRAFLKMTAFENVMTAAVYGGKHHEQGPKERTLEALELVELSAKAHESTKHLTLSDRRLAGDRDESRLDAEPHPAGRADGGPHGDRDRPLVRGSQGDQEGAEILHSLDRAQGRCRARLL